MPLISLILATRDRPDFFPVALACYRHQMYATRELIVVDSGDRFPVDPDAVAAAGGRLIRADPETPLGDRLNVGIAAADGYLCLKMDDDNWYGPGFLETMVGRLLADWRDASRASLAGAQPYLVFDLARWKIGRTHERHTAGASVCFRKEDWAACPFRSIRSAVDYHFLRDQAELGTRLLTVPAPEVYLSVRHGGVGNNRGHTWTTQEDYLSALPPHTRGPEDLLPAWVLTFYRQMRLARFSEAEVNPSRVPRSGEFDSGGR
jgi:glycosyltransferase involved in cell wall biosynthesis